MTTARAYAAFDPTSPLGPFSLERRAVGPTDVAFAIKYCGVCHSDLHTARGEWAGTTYPCVPGHELVGVVTAVGTTVSGFKVGDLAGVGCMVDSCRECASCRDGLEQYCDNFATTYTYNSVDKLGTAPVTYGGYSDHIVVDERFCLRISPTLDLASAAPLLCAGVTLWSPLRRWKAGPGMKVGIVGLGGLGHMGVKLAHALGAHTVLFTTSPGKVVDAKRLGADDVVISTDAEQMAAQATSFDLIINTVSAPHDLNVFLGLLKRDGTMVLVGAPAAPHPALIAAKLFTRRRSLAGSLIGGIKETQEMLDFCAEHGIVSDIELIPVQDIDRAFDRMIKSDVQYRFVLDMGTLAS
jgi:uncharacterized zinc-type alcohol dehydrogenase-like protein